MLPLISGTALAAAVLVIIHFFGLRLRQKLEFSHIQFLRVLIARTQSVRKVNNYLLLVLRLVFICSALAAFLLFLSQLNKGTAASSGTPELVLDSSWSMQSSSVEKGITKHDLALSAYEDLSLNSQNTGGTQSSVTTGQIDPDPITLTSSGAALIDEVKDQSRSSRTFILSDFQRSVFTPEVLQRLPKNQGVTLVSYATPSVPNLFIDSVWLDQPILLPNSLVGISVRVAGSLLDKSSQAKITASEGGKLLGATQVLVDPSEKAIARFRIPLQTGAAKQITFNVDDASTPFDNDYFVVLPAPVSVSIRLSAGIGPNHPIAQAYKAEPAFTLSNDLQSTSALWILDISSSGGYASVLPGVKSWLEKGGSVMLIPSANANQTSIEFLSALGLRGVSEESDDIGQKLLRQPDLSDAFFGQVFEKEVKNMKMPEATPVLRWQSAFHTILKFTDNTPFLSTFKVGKGNVHLFSSPITSTSAFVAHPLFVPVLYQLALTSSSSKMVLAHQPANGTITIPLVQAGTAQQPYTLNSQGQTFIPDQKELQNQLVMTLPNDIRKPGFYTLSLEGRPVSTIALNIPRTESRLEGYTTDELKEILKGHGNAMQVLEPQERVSLEKQLQKEASGSSLWKYCLILCFLCLLAEAFILSTKKSGSPS
ncbi:BatA domain-containing protein [Sabulibacter ruber]|uniref:BatA domain-containing protein n=1 Tax=Sabulibacter ruber TaxID=2811901 RepID=UPI001A9667F1|nr:BatA domain-containing protein [Sabulibacter ruber]